jgi:hypothetical protein
MVRRKIFLLLEGELWMNGCLVKQADWGALPLTTTGDVDIGYPFLGSDVPRTMQLAAKFTF